ncbi:hypothetical protein AeMF1_005432 [Aphanomyces euteiches]|nr:hypothetical protein AeMF1_005432 [Aphanomyces euteiches]
MIKSAFKDGLEVFNIMPDVYDQIVVVTDNGSNCCGCEGIPSEFTWFPCLDHKIATILTSVLNKTTNTTNGVKSVPFYRFKGTPGMDNVFKVIDQSKKLVEFFKRTNLQCQLTKTLKQENVTRWNSLLRCLESIHEMYNEVVDLLRQKDQLPKINSISQTQLSELVQFLNLFQWATLELEQFKQPTLHKIIFVRHRLLGHLQTIAADEYDCNGVVIKMAQSSTSCPEENSQVVVEIHIKAALLDPIAKRRLLRMSVEADKIESAKKEIKKDMAKFCSMSLDEVVEVIPVSKKPRVASENQSMYDMNDDDSDGNSELLHSSGNCDSRIEIEYAQYWQHRVSSMEKQSSEVNGSFQVLAWWKQFGAKHFPILACVARSILCIPASSAMSENNFSDAGNTLTKKRNRLKPRVLNDLLFLRSNRDICTSVL